MECCGTGAAFTLHLKTERIGESRVKPLHSKVLIVQYVRSLLNNLFTRYGSDVCFFSNTKSIFKSDSSTADVASVGRGDFVSWFAV